MASGGVKVKGFASSLFELVTVAPPARTRGTTRQQFFAVGITVWQYLKTRLPFLNNLSYIVGVLAIKLFPPVSTEATAGLPWGTGAIVIPAGSPSTRIYLAGRYEIKVVQKIQSLPLDVPGTVAVDVGAHVGYYTKLMADCVGSAGAVFAFEPNPISFEYLKRNTHRQHDAPLYLFPEAVGAETTRGFLDNIYTLEHGMIRSSGHTGSYSVPVTTLDNILWSSRPDSSPGRLGLIKVDTEGFEVNVIAGATGLFKKHPEVSLIIEHQELPENDSYRQLAYLLLSSGFSSYQILERGTWHDLADPFPFPTHRIVYNLYLPPRGS